MKTLAPVVLSVSRQISGLDRAHFRKGQPHFDLCVLINVLFYVFLDTVVLICLETHNVPIDTRDKI